MKPPHFAAPIKMKILESQINLLGAVLRKESLTLAVAESCTGGQIASAITSCSGVSDYFLGGYITYHNSLKMQLGVSPKTLSNHGAVSEVVAAEMLWGLKKNCLADVAISVTGVAGPTGGSPSKPVGTVFIGSLVQNNHQVQRYLFKGSREDIQFQTTKAALLQTYFHLNTRSH